MGYYDLSPTKVGQVQNFQTLASDFGGQSRVYSGLEFNLNARLPGGAQLTGGTMTQRVAQGNCNLTVDNPSKVFCDLTPPFLTTVKLMGTYTLPWNTQVSGSWQMLPGPALNGTRSYLTGRNPRPWASIGYDDHDADDRRAGLDVCLAREQSGCAPV